MSSAGRFFSSRRALKRPRASSSSASSARGYGPSSASSSASSPGVDSARRSLASSGVLARQYSGIFHVTRAPTLTGQCTLAVVHPARPAASHRVGTRMSSAYQYQAL